MSETATKNDLITFAGPIFDLVLRLKAGIVAPSNELRPKVASMLDDFEKRAERYRFNHKVVNVAKFGLAAFVDETVLTANFPLRNEWEKNPLQLQYFGEQLAGNKFFDKLDSMLGQIEITQDAVEIYYYCLLLGFKGKYGVYEQEKLLERMQTTANALVKVGKIKAVELSPNWIANDQPKPPEKRGLPVWAKIGAMAFVGLGFIVYLVMFLLSSKFLQETIEKLRV
ncbi:MAG: type IVB secretion system protein IcmH/DotU [Pyrinomonadaceae bacterium]|jgi:type VI secretion system protein ImpK|nr:type IVB secretion system protein IcmH/DotU [Blastocatellia bacterium]MCW5955506.1 type IVB secretion system protein IcmH/DotU [Pyrinomonadaceae bacterium]